MGGSQTDMKREGDGRLATRTFEAGGDALRPLLLVELDAVH